MCNCCSILVSVAWQIGLIKPQRVFHVTLLLSFKMHDEHLPQKAFVLILSFSFFTQQCAMILSRPSIHMSRLTKNVNIFLSVLNIICFGCSKEPSH